MNLISGFSKLSKEEKIDLIVNRFFDASTHVKDKLVDFWDKNPERQKVFDEFSENTLTNFFSPYGVVPNVKINGELFCVPMVTEESSVVAAASKAAKFWCSRGGIKTKVLGTEKVGQVHFFYEGNGENLVRFFKEKKRELLEEVQAMSSNMTKRGGGILSLDLLDKRALRPHYYQLFASFNTCDAMGANFINSILEALGKKFSALLNDDKNMSGKDGKVEVLMGILSNYTPNCLVQASVACPVEKLGDAFPGMDGASFASKFEKAVDIARIDPHRAVTHNKGIFNGIDAVVLATGNDFRAVEAGGHAYAARDGCYRGLTHCQIKENIFMYTLKVPLSLGTVGGLTKLHPMAEFSLRLLKHPSASKLMEVTAAMGLVQNFAALRSLVTVGIQKGHMKMHLLNILGQLGAREEEKRKMIEIFSTRAVSFKGVREEMGKIRKLQ